MRQIETTGTRGISCELRDRLLILFLVLSIVLPLSGLQQLVDAAGKVHYIAVASDRHSDENAIDIAMSGMPDTVEYVCLNGDMVNSEGRRSGGDGSSPSRGGTPARIESAYNTSTILKEVQAVFPKLTGNDVSIIYGAHDAHAQDDAGIMKCVDANKLAASNGSDNADISKGRSGLIYTGYDDNKPAYYIYGVSYYDMMNTGEKTSKDDPQVSSFEAGGKESAENFMKFADEHPDLPLIVVSHVPIHAKRGDNLAASYWNEALNYAATGSKSGNEIKREVVFLSGHNHTIDLAEYDIKPGATLTVQGTSRGASAESRIYYTYLTAGYLKDNHTAALVAVQDGHLSFTKYKGYVVKFETNGGEEIPYQAVIKGSLVTEPAVPVRAGYVFTGWYKEAYCENLWDFSKDTVSGDMQLYAGWIKGARPDPTVISSEVRSKKKEVLIRLSRSTGASDYRISYKKTTSANWNRIWTNDENNYTITRLAAKGLYDFKAAAVAESGDRMLYSADSNISRRYISTVDNIKATAGKNSITLSWKKDKKAASYVLQYSTSKQMKKPSTVTLAASKTSYKISKLKKGKRYYIRMRPLVKNNKDTYTGAFSGLISRKAK